LNAILNYNHLIVVKNKIKKWADFELQEIALKYKTKNQWKYSKDCSSYRYALENKSINKFTVHMNCRNEWNYAAVKEMASRFKSSLEWIKVCSDSYAWASSSGYLKELSIHFLDLRLAQNREERDRVRALPYKVKPPKSNQSDHYWDEKSVLKEAKLFLIRKDWEVKSSGSYRYAKVHGLIDKATKHMQSPKSFEEWTKEKCIERASQFTTIKEWRENDKKSYVIAIHRKWLTELSMNMKNQKKLAQYWANADLMALEMKKHSRRKEFAQNSSVAYYYARKFHKELLNKIFPLTERSSTSLGEETTKVFLSKLFNKPFIKARHKFLRNPKTGRPLELDGYCECLNLAFEYGDHEALKSRQTKDQYESLRARDKFKREKCKKLGITLLQLTKDSMLLKDSANHLKNQIKEELLRLGGSVPSNFDSVELKIIQFEANKWNTKKIWGVAKKCMNITHFRRTQGQAFYASIRFNMLTAIKEYFKKKKNHWTVEEVLENAKGYKNISSFFNENKPQYRYAKRNGFLDIIQKDFNNRNPKPTWTLSEAIDVAKKYKNITEFSYGDGPCHTFARKHKFLHKIKEYLFNNRPINQIKVYSVEEGLTRISKLIRLVK
jgi:hypothetical protein